MTFTKAVHADLKLWDSNDRLTSASRVAGIIGMCLQFCHKYWVVAIRYWTPAHIRSGSYFRVPLGILSTLPLFGNDTNKETHISKLQWGFPGNHNS